MPHFFFYTTVQQLQRIDKSGAVQVEADNEEDAKLIIRQRIREYMFYKKKVISDPKFAGIIIAPLDVECKVDTARIIISKDGKITSTYKHLRGKEIDDSIT